MASQQQAYGAPTRAPWDDRSIIRGETQPALSDSTVYGLLADTAARLPGEPAAVFREPDVRWTWRELLAQVDALASAFLELGLVKGDRVGIWSPNRPEWVVTQFATARLGLILVNINPAYREAELEYALNKVACRALVTAESFKRSNYLEMLFALAPELAANPVIGEGRLDAARLPFLETVIRLGQGDSPGMLSYDALIERHAGRFGPLALDAISDALSCDEPINIQFTSGTTGQPKGATLTHRNIVNNAAQVAAGMGLREGDKLCIPVPLYHCFGMVMSVLACVSTGATMVFPGEGFDPLGTLEAVSEERCTGLHGVPTMFIAQLEHPRFAEFDLSSLRTGIMAGSPCPVEVMKRVMSEMHMRDVTIGYGMTETSPISFLTSSRDPTERRVATVGRIQPHLEAMVVDPGGTPAALGEVGELWVRGYSVMLGYWDDEPRTREAVVDGWMRTGDLATFDAEGYCTIVGRLKDMLIRGGENIYPREIEELLFRHPKVQSVQVFGVPDARYGEEVCAWVVLRAEHEATEDEVREFCRAHIAHYKVPRYVRFVDEIPMTVTGKAQKFVMRERMMALIEGETL